VIYTSFHTVAQKYVYWYKQVVLVLFNFDEILYLFSINIQFTVLINEYTNLFITRCI